VKAQQLTGAVDDLTNIANNKEAYQSMVHFFDQVDRLGRRKVLNGKEGLEQLLNFKKAASDVTWTLKQQAEERGHNVVSRNMSKYKELVDNGVKSNLGKRPGLKELYEKLNANHEVLSGHAADLSNALRASYGNGSNKSFQTLLNQVGAESGKNTVQKTGLNTIVQTAESLGLAQAGSMRHAHTMIKVNDAAIQMNPIMTKRVAGALTAAGGLAATGNPLLAAGAAAGGVAASPRTALFTSSVVNSMWKGKDLLQAGGRGFAKQLTDNPAALNAFVASIVQTPMMQEQVKQSLLNQAAQQAQPIQGQ
jgi:hypothetical protein